MVVVALIVFLFFISAISGGVKAAAMAIRSPSGAAEILS
jgi:hypothetical protein